MSNENDLLVHQFSCLDDNYGVLIHEPETGRTLAIDVPDSSLYAAELRNKKWKLTDILITHHHADHTQGLLALKESTGAHVVGPKLRRPDIPGIDQYVGDGDRIEWAGRPILALATPGHTLDQISFWFPNDRLAHTGDTLFALGCGRIFEGDAPMMWQSLTKLIDQLPEDTRIYCGHEYTAANARFAISVDPDNEELKTRCEEIARLSKDGQPCLPTMMGVELATNPFLRAGDKKIAKHLNMEGASPAEIFTEIRRRKDEFRG